jgi:stage III sporulation protein SpoIIIAA
MSYQFEGTNDLGQLIEVLPPRIKETLQQDLTSPNDLLEIILDLGRLPEARYRAHERFLSDTEITEEDIEFVTSRIGSFGEDNRAGIPRTLHRISAIRNRNGHVIGMTCRAGRAIFGTVDIIRDIIESGKSILLLGKPGTGKTTLLRETARVLAEDMRKRVVIVDTSNEIAGDGDIPHPGIGRARRMQVIRPSEQHAVMIEAVENHMPEVIVIDEIGTELEAMAARTIAERGVQLIGTAHGNTLDNLMVNPTLSDLIGGIQAVTLGDEEARRRGTQKTVLERKSPPTFDVLIEIQSWDQVIAYNDVSDAVDLLLFGEEYQPELRRRDEEGNLHTSVAPPRTVELGRGNSRRSNKHDRKSASKQQVLSTSSEGTMPALPLSNTQVQRIFPFGINRNRLEQVIGRLRIPAILVRDMQDATLVMTLKNYYRRSPQRLRQAESQGVPVYVLRSNTSAQMERQLMNIFQLDMPNEPFSLVPPTKHHRKSQAREEDEDMGDEDDEWYEEENGFYTDPESLEHVLIETETAITQLINGERDVVEMDPQNSYVRRLQHQLAQRYNLQSKSRGSEPYRRVRISR